MAYVKTDDTHYKNIGNALRETLGEDSEFMPSDMGEAIRYSNEESYNKGNNDGYTKGNNDGFAKGFEEGEESGYQSGYNDAYEVGEEEGKQTQYDEFWDGIQDSGERESYQAAFKNWGSEYIRPKHKVEIVNQTDKQYGIFQKCKNLKKIEKEYFDFTQYVPATDASTGSWYYTFSECETMEYFEDLGLQAGGYYNTWLGCRNLHTIEVMRCCEEGKYSNHFANCKNLKNVVIEGVIGTNWTSKDSPLSVASLKSVITHLKDFSGTANEYSYTVTFKSTAFAELEAEGNTSPNGNTWSEYIDDLKWNLTLA